MAGRLESLSGFKSAIWAFDLVRYEYPDLHLVIFGEGPEREGLEDFGLALMFDDYRFASPAAGPMCRRYSTLAEFVWVTHERGGVALALEAMAAGRPVSAGGPPR